MALTQSFPLKLYPAAQEEQIVAEIHSEHLAAHDSQFPMLFLNLPFPQVLLAATQRLLLRVNPPEQAVQYDEVKVHSEQGY